MPHRLFSTESFSSSTSSSSTASSGTTKPSSVTERLWTHDNRPDHLVLVSHQLPVSAADGREPLLHRGSTPGDRVEAICAAVPGQAMTWVGSCDVDDDDQITSFTRGPVQYELVSVPAAERVDGEQDFCDQILWPLYHDIIAHPDLRRTGWDAYSRTNQRFADRVVDAAAPGATVWVLDHHLQLVPAMVRSARPDLRIGFFCDIPFPPLELLYHLPWHREILAGLLGADLVGFQLPRHQRNFVESVQVAYGHPVHPSGLHVNGRHLRTGAYPTAVQSAALSALASTRAAAEEATSIRALLGDPTVLLLAVDHLDCTAGIYERLQAFEELIRDKLIDPQHTVLVQIATTSPERVDGKCQLRDDIDRLVGRINGDAARFGHPPVIYVHTTGSDATMAGLYRAADVLLCTPLRDGMGLAAKEYIASRQADDGAVVLSIMSGAADQLHGAYTVNPYDLEASKAGLLQAVGDNSDERAVRMRRLRDQVAAEDLTGWAHEFLRDLASRSTDVPCPTPNPQPLRELLRDQPRPFAATVRSQPSHPLGRAFYELS